MSSTSLLGPFRTHSHIRNQSEAITQKLTQIREHTGSREHEEGNHTDKDDGRGRLKVRRSQTSANKVRIVVAGIS